VSERLVYGFRTEIHFAYAVARDEIVAGGTRENVGRVPPG
jgi:hypothetical protein